jgi:membrane dipeptidase
MACATAPPDPRAVHERVLTLDSHLDTPANSVLRPGWDITVRHEVAQDGTNVDLPRMIEGGLDGGFFVVYTPQGPRTPEAEAAALAAAKARIALIGAIVSDHPQQFAMALRADDAAPIAAAGKRVVFISMENAYPISSHLEELDWFYAQGLRMAGPVHFRNNDLADSSTDPGGPQWHGLSEAGRRFVAEANRLGIILDASHASDDVLDQMLDLSTTPVILSHSGCKAIYDHPRNVDDEHLRRVAAKGGVIQMNALGAYLEALPPTPERSAALAALNAEFGADSEDVAPLRRADYLARRAEIERTFPAARSSFEVYMRHVLHALEVVGPEHVGIGADWDGGGGVDGLADVAAAPRITEALITAGYSERDIANIWSGNLLRVLRAVEAAKRS